MFNHKKNLFKGTAIIMVAALMVNMPLSAMAAEGSDLFEEAQAAAAEVVEAANSAGLEMKAIAAESDTVFTEGEAYTNEAGKDNAVLVKEAIEAVANDTTAVDVIKIKSNLIDAEKVAAKELYDGENIFDKDSTVAVMNANNSQFFAEGVNELVNAAAETANTLKQQIADAETEEEAKQAKEELKNVVSGTIETYGDMVNTFNDVKAEYEKAKNQLINNANAYDEAIATASSKAASAKDALVEAQKKVDKLNKAVEDALKALEASNKEVYDVITLQQEMSDNADSYSYRDAGDKLFETMVINYFIPTMYEGATDVTVDSVLSLYDRTWDYFKVTYTDAEGNVVTKLYNYLLEDGSTNSIAIFPIDEIQTFLVTETNKYLSGEKEYDSDFDLWLYYAPLMNNGFYFDKQLKQSSDEGFAEYLGSASEVIEKYVRISKEAEAAKKQLKASEAAVEKLSYAIKELEKQNNNAITSVIKSFNTENPAELLGIKEEVDEDFFNNLTLKEAIYYLDELIGRSEDKIKNASLKLEEIKELIVEEILPVLPVVPEVTPAVPDEVITVVTANPVAPAVNTTQVVLSTVANSPVAVAAEAVTVIEENVVPLANAVEVEPVEEPKQPVLIEDNEVPLAGGLPVEPVTPSWWWLYLLLVAVAVGGYTYTRYQKNREEA